MADNLVPGIVIHAGVSLGELPDVALDAGASWGVDIALGAVPGAVVVGQAQLDGQGLQGPIFLQ